jgi:hypothetical protein
MIDKKDEKKDEYKLWWKDNLKGSRCDDEWYMKERLKYVKRKTRPLWMNMPAMIEYEDKYIQYLIIFFWNYEKERDICLMKRDIVSKECPQCNIVSYYINSMY